MNEDSVNRICDTIRTHTEVVERQATAIENLGQILETKLEDNKRKIKVKIRAALSDPGFQNRTLWARPVSWKGQALTLKDGPALYVVPSMRGGYDYTVANYEDLTGDWELVVPKDVIAEYNEGPRYRRREAPIPEGSADQDEKYQLEE